MKENKSDYKDLSIKEMADKEFSNFLRWKEEIVYRKFESLEKENESLKSKLKKCETELSYCKKYDLYYED